MDFLNKIKEYFIKPSVIEEQKNKTTNNGTQILKNLFTKNDPMSLTEFPYQWEKDFFAPLEPKEAAYMKKEIIKWYAIYIELFMDKLIEGISMYVLKNTVDKGAVVDFNQEFPEEFQLMIQEIMLKYIFDIVEERVHAFSDDYLIFWKPKKGEQSWEPPRKEFIVIIKQLGQHVIQESKEQLDSQRLQLKQLLEEQQQNDYRKYSERVSSVLTDYLKQNKVEIIRNCNARMLLEYNSFPHYYGIEEKVFNNEIFRKYKEDFNVTSFNELVAKVYPHLQRFLKIHGKDELLRWFDEQWFEFTYFMQQEYSRALENNIQLEPKHFNKYIFSIDFFALMLFKISIDGM